MEINLTKIVSTLFLSFMFYNFFQLYKLFTPELCTEQDPESHCYSVSSDLFQINFSVPFQPIVRPNSEGLFDLLQLRVYFSTKREALETLVTTIENVQVAGAFQKDVSKLFHLSVSYVIYFIQVQVKIPPSVARDGYLYAHVILLPHKFEAKNPMHAPWKVHVVAPMIVFQEPVAKTFQLLGDSENEKKEVRKLKKTRTVALAAHFRSVLPIRIVSESNRFVRTKVSGELA